MVSDVYRRGVNYLMKRPLDEATEYHVVFCSVDLLA